MPRRGGAAGRNRSSPPRCSATAAEYEDMGVRLGEGTYGVVDLCRRVCDGAPAALKRPAQPPGGPLSEMAGEGAVLGRLRHHNIVALLDTVAEPWEDGPVRTTLALEYADAGCLRELLLREGCGGLRADVALGVTRQLADACGHMHRRGVVHRDIKPGNVLFAFRPRPHLKGSPPPRPGPNGGDHDKERVVKLCDFGVARVVEGEGTVPGDGAIVLPCGEICYAAPEQVRLEEHGAPCDVWAVGAVLFHSATGSAPFFSPEDVLAFAAAEWNPSAHLPTEAPLYCAGLIELLLAARPGRRPGAEALLRRLVAGKPIDGMQEDPLFELMLSPQQRPGGSGAGSPPPPSPPPSCEHRPASASPRSSPAAAAAAAAPAEGAGGSAAASPAPAARDGLNFGAKAFSPSQPRSPPSSAEKRLIQSGEFVGWKTKEQFKEIYGTQDTHGMERWQKEWDCADSLWDKRGGGHSQSAPSSLPPGGGRSPPPGAEERRLDDDGGAYTRREFAEFYGGMSGEARWHAAPPAPSAGQFFRP